MLAPLLRFRVAVVSALITILEFFLVVFQAVVALLWPLLVLSRAVSVPAVHALAIRLVLRRECSNDDDDEYQSDPHLSDRHRCAPAGCTR